jgi:uncharacterized phage protein (TIGR02220 family)
MAVGKKKVIVYTDWINQFKDLTDEEAGKLIKHFFEYVNDLNPTSDRLTELLFNPIKATLKRDLEAWESKQQTNKENGAKGGRPKKNTETEINPNNPVGFLETQNNPQKGVSVNVSVNDINNNNIVESIDYDHLLKYINESFGRSFKVVNNKVKAKYKSLFKQGYKKEQVREAIDNVKNNQYHKETNYQYCTIEFFSRPETLDKYSSVTKVQDDEVIQDDYYLNIMKKLNQQ